MNDTLWKVAIAAFIHDVGKFTDPAVLGVPEEYIEKNQNLYQPCVQGRYSHQHAVLTAAFIEHLRDHLPKEFNANDWGEGDCFVNLAASHHKPETPLQWIIAVADRLSSGWERAPSADDGQQPPTRDYRKVRLIPLFQRLDGGLALREQNEASSWVYPLKPVSPSTIFPVPCHLETDVDRETASTAYRELFRGFVDGVKNLLHRDDNLGLWFEHFDSLMMIWTSAIPSDRSGRVLPDISLYDHSRTTAALATALYLYHKETGPLKTDAIKDYSTQKFLIVTGDFYGIQQFIFSCSGETRKYRSKLLRGRSLQVSLFSELTADRLCRELGLPFSSVVLNAAGKFTAIFPNTEGARKVVEDVQREVNQWLTRISLGESSVGLSYREACPNDFVQHNFAELWDRLQDDADRKKCSRLDLNACSGVVHDYLDRFNQGLAHPLCPLCGKRPSSDKVENTSYLGGSGSACTICRDHIFLGAVLPKKKRLAVLSNTYPYLKPDNSLLEPIFGQYQVGFFDGEDLSPSAKNNHLLRYWELSSEEYPHKQHKVTVKHIGGYVPLLTQADEQDPRIQKVEKDEETIESLKERIGDPKTFSHIAAKARTIEGNRVKGIAALGILKADVDNLGFLMSCGLPQDQFSVSRMATLSRQLHLFFSLYVPHLLKTNSKFIDVYTVFSGGDDLFLIGPWNRIVELSQCLWEKFTEYVCHNPAVTFSAGICLEKPHRPVDKMAETAERGLAQSKRLGRARNTLFRETATWQEFAELQGISTTLRKWLDHKWVNKAMLYRLNHLIDMADMEKRVVSGSAVHLQDMDCTKWRAMLAYSVERNAAKGFREDERKTIVKEVSEKIADWLSRYYGKLRIPLWQVLYEMR